MAVRPRQLDWRDRPGVPLPLAAPSMSGQPPISARCPLRRAREGLEETPRQVARRDDAFDVVEARDDDPSRLLVQHHPRGGPQRRQWAYGGDWRSHDLAD